jgi:hypothetical protein
MLSVPSIWSRTSEVPRALKEDEVHRLKALEQEPRGRLIVVALPDEATRRVRCPQNLSPKEDRLSGPLHVGQDPLSSSQISAWRSHYRQPTTLPNKEVVRSVHCGNKKAAFAATSSS